MRKYLAIGMVVALLAAIGMTSYAEDATTVTGEPVDIACYLGGKSSEQDLRKMVHKTDTKAADAQVCEAEFFIGQRKFVAGQKDAAKVHFAAALKSKSTQLSAYRGAKFAIK